MERGNAPAAIAAAVRFAPVVPDLTLAGVYLLTWIAPAVTGVARISYLVDVVVLEMVNIHAGAIIGVARRAKRTVATSVLAVAYTALIVMIAKSLGQWWIVWAFWGLTANRAKLLSEAAPGVVSVRQVSRWGFEGTITSSGSPALWRWALSVVLFVGILLATTFLPLPVLGLTAAVAHLSGSGLWVDEPHRLIAFGVAYYVSQAWLEVLEIRSRGRDDDRALDLVAPAAETQLNERL